MLNWPKKAESYKPKNLLSRIKMGKEILTFRDIEIEKKYFYRNKTPVSLRDV